LVLLGWATQVDSQGPLFSPAPGSPVKVGEGSGKVLLVDVNGDGNLDLVTQHLLRHIVAVQLGDGTGRFVAGSSITLGYQPGDIKLGDVNGDKILDLAVSRSEPNKVDIFFGEGKGSFNLAPGSPFTVSAAPEKYTYGLQLVDLNEDGNLDIVTANNRRNTCASLLGNGRGGFAPGPIVTFPAGHSFYTFAFDDVDGDRHLDIVIASGEQGESAEPGRVTWLRGDGKGAFKEMSAAPLSVPVGPRYLTLGDVNGDGRLDVVISHFSEQLSVMLNNGQGKFTPAPASPYNLRERGYAVVAADVNRDKKSDLVVATADNVIVLLSDKAGFVPAPGSPFAAGPGAYHLTVGDINKDGKLDVAASSFEGNAVTVLLGR
jgi:hypothetical protein